MGALGKFEVVLGYVVEYVNSPFCRTSSGIILLVANPNVIEKALTRLLSGAKRLNDWNVWNVWNEAVSKRGPFYCRILSPDCSVSKRGRLLYSFFVRLTSDSTGLAHRCCAAGLRAGATTTRAAPPYPRSSLPLFTVVGNKKNVLGIASRAKFYS
jgi:hypothetical protein